MAERKPALVLLHGGALSAVSMAPIAARLPNYHCLMPDLRGHGTNRALPFLGLEQCAKDIAELIDREASGPVHLFGLSLGGYVALHVMVQRPAIVESAVVSGVALRQMKHTRVLERLIDIVYPLLGLKTLRALAGRAMGIDDGRLMSDPGGRGWARPETIRDLGHAVLRSCPTSLTEHLGARVLYLAGSKEPSYVRQGLCHIRTDTPCTEARIVGGGTHGWCLDNPDLAARTIDAWIRARALPDELNPVASLAPTPRADPLARGRQKES